MLNNASKYVFGLLALGAVTMVVADDKAAMILLLGLALGAAGIAIGLGRAVGADLAPFVGKDDAAATTALDPADSPVASAGPLIAGVGATLLAAGGALGPNWVIGGVVVAVIGVAVWAYDAYRAPGELTTTNVENVDNRLLGPIAMPVGAVVLTLTIAYSFSRVLLAVSQTASWVIALIVGAVVLAILAGIAEKVPTTRVVAVLSAIGMAGTLVAGGAGAASGEREFHHHEHEHAIVEVTAKDIAFDRKVVSLPAEEEVEMRFHNLDVGTFHNVGIYTAEEPGTPIYNGKPNARGTEIYKFESPEAGTYRYICDFHPAMVGELRVSDSAEAAVEEEESH